ncbi:hypothetical protein Cgig2_008806 [Carnegiea gigantea]|uniref:Uncharacterized protein n=1 Tax=Carnegiea gigantea TaxID=171969 RepID=A0A9Q1GVI7_9CARY|nr:hypothetical protein Cgig2_008806 [Carnegiea gigantea]
MTHLVFCEGNISEFLCDTKKLSVDNPNLASEESLVGINGETEVDELRLLSLIMEYIYWYVGHNDNTKLDIDDNDSMVDDDYNEYGSYFDNEEVARIIRKKNKKIDKDHLTDLEALRDERVEFIGGGNAFDDVDVFESHYHNSDDANSPPGETNEDVMMNEEREKRKGQPYILGTRKGQQKMGYIWKWACCL